MPSITGGDQLDDDYAPWFNREINSGKSTFYLIRHAEAGINLLDIIGGRSNHSPLTKRGITQAILLSERLDKINFDYILSSPAVRTIATMRISIANREKIDVQVFDDLQELSQGTWEGKPRQEVYTPSVLEEIRKDPWNFCPLGGESQNKVAKRFKAALEREAERRPGIYLVYTHGGCIKYFLHDVLELPKKEAWKMPIENTSITKANYSEGKWIIEYHNDFTHLLSSKLSTNL